MIKRFFAAALMALFSFPGTSCTARSSAVDIVEKTVPPASINVYWKDSSGKRIGTFPALFQRCTNLAFACNGGMYDDTPDRQPVGLYIEGGKKLRPLKVVNNGKVNFGMQPQGVFLVTKTNAAKVLPVEDYAAEKEREIRCATQSAPMLVMGGKVNPRLTKSPSTYTRNGVGILKNGQVLFLYAKTPVTFQQFAQLFVARGCVTAMYLDGAISQLLSPKDALQDRCACYGPFIGVSR